MPSKLKNLRVNRVDLVDRGASMDKASGEGAHVLLFKSEEQIQQAEWNAASIKDLPDSSFAVVESSGARHLPFKDASGKVSPAHLKTALARISQSKLPPELKNKARRKLMAAAREAGVGEAARKSEHLGIVASFLGLSDTDTSKLEQAAVTFDEEMERQDLLQSLADVGGMFHALERSVFQTLESSDGDKSKIIRQSLKQFSGAVSEAIAGMTLVEKEMAFVDKAGRKISSERLSRLKRAAETLMELIKEADVEKGKLDPEVRKQVEKMEADLVKATADLKAATEKIATLEKAAKPPEKEDVLKGLSEPVRKEVEALRKQAADAQALAKSEQLKRRQRDHTEVLKGFKGLPVDPEKDVALMIKLEDSLTPEEYGRVQELLRAGDEARLMAEVGKPGSEHHNANSAYAKIEAKAAELRKADPNLTPAASIAKAAEQNPELYDEYKQERPAVQQ